MHQDFVDCIVKNEKTDWRIQDWRKKDHDRRKITRALESPEF